jgi:hypothetical protein
MFTGYRTLPHWLSHPAPLVIAPCPTGYRTLPHWLSHPAPLVIAPCPNYIFALSTHTRLLMPPDRETRPDPGAKSVAAVLTRIRCWVQASRQSGLQAAEGTSLDAKTACLPCCRAVEVICVGGHEKREVACKDVTAYSCQQPCGAPLSCSNHTCTRKCHARNTGKPTIVQSDDSALSLVQNQKDAQFRCVNCTL